jgi:uncharacterized protein YcbX
VIPGTLGGLARWPVKTMAGERLRAARLDGRGLGGDRTHWAHRSARAATPPASRTWSARCW